MGSTLLMALLRMYSTPPVPQRDPKIEATPVIGHFVPVSMGVLDMSRAPPLVEFATKPAVCFFVVAGCGCLAENGTAIITLRGGVVEKP
jgi:hypothetical protein